LCSNQTSKTNKEANNKWNIEESCPKLSQIPQNCTHTHTNGTEEKEKSPLSPETVVRVLYWGKIK
jgi:hypothetical protein